MSKIYNFGLSRTNFGAGAPQTRARNDWVMRIKYEGAHKKAQMSAESIFGANTDENSQKFRVA